MGYFKLNKEELDCLINSIGAMTELVWLFYEDLIKQGFTEKQSLYLTSEWMVGTFAKGGRS